MSAIEEKVEKLVTGPIERIGYKVYDVMYEKEGKDNYLRIFIDNETGISLNDCERVNNEITDMLDEANIIKDQYFLEISSPGVERHIRKDSHLEQSLGQKIVVKLFKPLKIEEIESKEKNEEVAEIESKSKNKSEVVEEAEDICKNKDGKEFEDKSLEKNKKTKSKKNEESKKEITGILQEFNENTITIDKYIIPRENIASMHKAFDW